MSIHTPSTVVIPAHEHLILNVVGIVLYGALAIACLMTFSWRFMKRRQQEITSMRNLSDLGYYPIPRQLLIIEWLFKAFLLLFLISRILWLVSILCEVNDLEQFIVNRCAFAFFFTAFTLIMFYWAETIHKTYYESHSFLPKLGILFIISNLIIWSLQIIGILLFLSKNSDINLYNPFYVINVLVEACISVTISVGFFIYGLLLSCKKLYSFDGMTPALNIEVVKLVLSTIFFFACFLLRGIMYSYWFLTHRFIDDILYIILTYYVSELVPSVIQVIILQTTKHRTQFNSQFISNLYSIDEKSPLQDSQRYTTSTETTTETTTTTPKTPKTIFSSL